MTSSRALIIALAVCVVVAWGSGPLGRFTVALPLLLFAPGYLLERAVLAQHAAGAFTRPALWLAGSLSITALVYLWGTTLGLRLSAPLLTLLAALCALGVALGAWRARPPPVPPQGSLDARYGAALALVAVLAVSLWLRFLHIHDLALPAWVDSVHHALLIRVAADQGQAPLSLRPYLPVDQLPYHWGYHVVVAALLVISGTDLPNAMLWSGQVFNGLHVLTCAALAAYLWRRPWAGVVAGVVVGCLSIYPAYYVSWGRYTQLVGLLLLPPLAIAWREALRTRSWRWCVFAAVLAAGLSLIHVRALVFALCLLISISIVHVLAHQPLHFWMLVRRAIGSALLAAALSGPWLWLLTTRTLQQAAQSSRYIVNEAGSAIDPALLWAGTNHWLVALALLAALWGLARRARAAMSIALWVVGMFLLANPWIIGLPSLWLLSNEAVVISLFVPVSVLLGGGAIWLYDLRFTLYALRCTPGAPAFGLTFSSIVNVCALLTLAGVTAWGAWQLRSVVNPATVFATAADLRAIQWVAANTPPDARFLINAAPWQAGSERGADGGWWLLPLAGRWVSTPPVLALYGPPDYVRAVQQRNAAMVQFTPEHARQLFNLIACNHINYVYLGTQPGPVTAQVFADREGYTPVYNHEGVTVLAVPEETCYDPNQISGDS